jgi:NAD(P)-dependent dehydrogenase (short-subunit alcohol dehydrogenase family)
LQYLPAPDYLEYQLPEGYRLLITNEGSALTHQVIGQLESAGHPVLVLNLPGFTPISQHPNISLRDYSDEAVREALAAAQPFGHIGGFIHLHPHFEFQHGQFTQHFQAERQIVKAVFFLAKHLQPALNGLHSRQRPAFLTVTRMDGQLGQGRRGNVSVVGGGLPGLVKCLNLEWSPVFCRALDIAPELPNEAIATQILAELHDADVRHTEVAVSAEGRFTPVATPVAVPEHQDINTTVTPDSVFLVSGGARGVTATCVIAMAEAFACKFILLGRSDAAFQVPAFAEYERDEATLKRLIMNDLKERGEQPGLARVKQIYNNIVAKKEIEDTLSQIRRHGGQAIYIQGDAVDAASFRAPLREATQQLGKITGILHGAGRLADKYIQDKTEADFDNVLSVKLDGLLALLQSADIHHLDHLVLFSSVAGFYGNVGQTDYAIANEILSRAAHLFKTNHPNTHVAAINWGAWDSGMVSGELKAQFEAAGVSLVNSEGGAAMMVNEFNTAYAGEPQMIIGGTLPAAVSYIGAELQTYTLRRKLQLAGNPFLHHHVIQGNPVLPVVNAVGWMTQACERLYPDFRVFQVADTRLFKGIVFDGKEKEDYVTELRELEKSADTIVFEAAILSRGEKLPVYHYKARVTLKHHKAIPAAPQHTHRVSAGAAPEAGAGLYRDGSLFHGPYFQGIVSILECDRKRMVLSCVAPPVPIADQGQFALQTVNTFFTDIQYQGMVVWVQRFMDGAKSLPLQTDSARLYRPIPFGKTMYVDIAVDEATDFRMAATCTVYDETGAVYMLTEGAVLTVSKQLVW